MEERDLMVETVIEWKEGMQREDVPNIWCAYIDAWQAYEVIRKEIEKLLEAPDDTRVEVSNLEKAKMFLCLAMENCEHEIWGPRYEGWYDLHPRLNFIG